MQEWNTKKMGEKEISFTRIGQLLLRRWWMLVIVALIFGTVAYMYSVVFMEPTYVSGFSAYVNNRAEQEGKLNTSNTDLVASVNLVPVYQQIITSRSVLEVAAQECGVTTKMVKNSVSTSSSEDAAVLTVFVKTNDPQLSMDIANVIAREAPVKVAEVIEGSSMRIIDPPIKPSSASGPNYSQNFWIGAAVGAVLMALILVSVDFLCDFVQNSEELEKRYQLVVIGHIPDIYAAEKESNKQAKEGRERK